jgi:SAM-dependent methyltransferase
MQPEKDYFFEDESPLLSQAYLFDPILEIIKKHKPQSILDLGCGNGAIANKLIQMGYNVYGVDGSELGINYANSINPARFFVSQFESNELPEDLPIKKFEMVISTEVVEHVYSPKQYTEYCKKALLPNGYFVVSTPYHGYLKNILLAVFNKMDGHYGPLWEGGHVKFWSKKTLEILLKMNGFSDFEFKGCGRIPYIWKSMIIVGKNN